MDKISKNGDNYASPTININVAKANLRNLGNIQELMVPVDLSSQANQIIINYTFSGE